MLNVGFELPTPGVVALFGRSGCGKSTAINIIAGLLRPDPAAWCSTMPCCSIADAASMCRPNGAESAMSFRTPGCSRILSVAANLRYALRRRAGPRYVSLDTVVDLLALGSLMQQAHAPALRRRAAAGRHRARAVDASPACCCWTSRSPRSTRPGARRSCPTSSRCATSCAYRWCTSLTISRRSCGSPPTSS